MASQYLPRTISITVSSLSGTATIPTDYAGPVSGVAITPPGALKSTTFDFEVFDAEGIGQIGSTDCAGPTTMHEDIQFHNGGSIDLTNCSVDGVYTLRIWYHE
jgi:hypothetical protein